MALNTVSSDRLSTNVKNTNFTAAEKQDLTDDIKPLLGSSGGGNKNLIINGGHNVSQRGTAAVTVTSSADFRCVDRWKTDIDGSGGGDFSHAQSTDVPTGQGFTNSSKITTVTQASQPTSEGNRNQFYYQLEKQDVVQLGWGTSSAKTCTLSFWVKASITGVYPLWFQYYASGGNQYYYTNYTISAANTWEKKTITLTGPTSGGMVSGTTAVGFRIEWGLGYGSDSETGTLNAWTTSSTIRTASGSVYLPENAGATWYLTGCQFETSSVATDFDHRSFAQELALCQRYFYGHSGGTHTVNGSNSSTPDTVLGTCACQATTAISVSLILPVPMRAVPTLYSTVTGSTRYRLNSYGANTNSGSDLVMYTAGSTHTLVQADLAGFSGLVAGDAGTVRRYTGSGVLGFQAEL